VSTGPPSPAKQAREAFDQAQHLPLSAAHFLPGIEVFGNERWRHDQCLACVHESLTGSAVDRVKFYKMAWDAVGSEFASRHSQYEMFYAGATFVTKGHAFRTYDWKAATALLDRMLSSYDLADELAAQANPPSRAVA